MPAPARDVERAAVHGNLILPRRVDAAGNIAVGRNAAIKGTTVDDDDIGIARALRAVARDHRVVRRGKGAALNEDFGAGGFARDHGCFPAR